jgi:Ulp1 family protease
LSTENHLLPTLFLSQFEKFGHIHLQRYLKPINIWSLKTLIFQRCSGGHWFTIIVKPEVQNIEILDSINRPTKSKSLDKFPNAVKPLITLLEEDDKWRHDNKFNKKEWSFNYRTCREQPNTYDSGVHVCIHLSV